MSAEYRATCPLCGNVSVTIDSQSDANRDRDNHVTMAHL